MEEINKITGYIIIFLLSLQPSCINRPVYNVPDIALHQFEIDYIFDSPEPLKDHKMKEFLDVLVSNYLDSVNFDQYIADYSSVNSLDSGLISIYKQFGNKLIWHKYKHPLPKSSLLIDILQHAYQYGLDPDDYEINSLLRKQDKVKYDESTIRQLIDLDILMTSKYLLLGYHLNAGRLNPVKEMEEWFINKKEVDIDEVLIKGLKSGNLQAAIEDLHPENKWFQPLKEQYLNYLQLAKSRDIDVSKLGSLSGISPGDTGEVIIELKKFLQHLGDMEKVKKVDHFYDEKLSEAISRFQKRHGLDESGLIDDSTERELQVPLEERLKKLVINMERLKWLPEFGEDYIMVNIPEYRMKLYEKGKKQIDMKAIVGTEMNPTPVMNEEMSYIVINPTWTVPTSISSKEFLPKIKDDKDFFEKNHFLLYESWTKDAELLDPEDVDWDDYSEDDFPFKIVQKPGTHNALGHIQFMMPNNQAIYLHDTPADYLFDNDDRTFSHGCVRLEQPFELAEYLLKYNNDWNVDSMQNALQEEEPVNVTLPEKWPVFLLYQTAWIDEDGLLNFRDDVYEFDALQWSLLNQDSHYQTVVKN